MFVTSCLTPIAITQTSDTDLQEANNVDGNILLSSSQPNGCVCGTSRLLIGVPAPRTSVISQTIMMDYN